ncbi:glycosyltransferase family 2 protein [Thermosynechococcus sp. HN-54]|uniref:glycosyltransferase n=1 Tax=Thermosynechococcus sp. HN-54 TaxID=2933959 RepID=UPI00202D00FC|nr:glycosyltransferase family A protein [Thermosynechococcus sp. HN-54]URR34344.1 glycosyltransferase family 2 protein [Thermosynechococcus sp. HN-54]
MSSTPLLPTFSIILETENLANADMAGLHRALQSLASQDLPPTVANEVLLLETGDAPQAYLAQLADAYPWLTFCAVPKELSYYEVKMWAAKKATGEVIVYCDSDCCYERSWLRRMVTSFTADEQIRVVAGETAIRGAGIYRTAMALTYIFPQYSGGQRMEPAAGYFLNNVAFRRQFLLDHPIPTELPLYRGNCVIHAYTLLQQGECIWCQPQARASHAPPNGLSHFYWRFLLIGHDYYWQQRLLGKLSQRLRGQDHQGWRGKFRIFGQRLRQMVRHDPRHIFFLPLALPIILVSVLLILIGYQLTTLKPHYLLKAYERILGKPELKHSNSDRALPAWRDRAADRQG